MARPDTVYDLMLLLRADQEEQRRDEILSQAAKIIQDGGGSLVSQHDWGIRPMTFEINHTPDAEYELLQFTGPSGVLDQLQHTLRITDGVMRFRIIKVKPGTPPPPEVRRDVVAPAEL